jgi:hypothetical protein
MTGHHNSSAHEGFFPRLFQHFKGPYYCLLVFFLESHLLHTLRQSSTTKKEQNFEAAHGATATMPIAEAPTGAANS